MEWRCPCVPTYLNPRCEWDKVNSLARRAVLTCLVDRGLYAALLGDGSKLYSGSRAGLKLLTARVLPGSQLVELRYDATGSWSDPTRHS